MPSFPFLPNVLMIRQLHGFSVQDKYEDWEDFSCIDTSNKVYVQITNKGTMMITEIFLQKQKWKAYLLAEVVWFESSTASSSAMLSALDAAVPSRKFLKILSFDKQIPEPAW